ncbi:hypothetical protein D8Y20_06050 [Mariprofundus sp. EBB-1]|uniref:hypothetical protein n=1 Tax=Mariprofundus sp. EBB-1 TaxID=2650971 RepID=UPI000EF21178|nr:hypothetical protein [Mariprofundus sp. EBB-1]RLL53056.1 hypothetical protein D8Y20_06050 [Mariprofundus sp. EBB-1]
MRLVILTSIILALSACAGAKQANDVAPTVEKGGLLGLSTVSDIELKGKEAVKGEVNVAVPYFKVAFYTEQTPGGYTNGSGDKHIIHSTLVGVDSALLQKVTDQAYANFVSQLKQKGFNVLPTSALNRSKTYSAIKQTNTQYKDEALFGPDAIYVTPSGMRVSDASITRMIETNKIMKELNTSVMDVTLYVSYLSQSFNKAAGFVVTSINVGQTTTVTPGSMMTFYGLEASKCNGYCPNTVAYATLGQPVFDTEKVGVLKNVTSSTDKAGDVALTALSWMTKSGTKIHNTDRFELTADPNKYAKVVTGVISKATDKLVSALAANR